jgi:hypothetical protein
VYRERNDNQSKSWKNSFKLLSINNELMIIEFSNDSTKFRSTTIKSYYDDHVDNVDLEKSSLFISIIDLNSLIIASVSKSSNMSRSND